MKRREFIKKLPCLGMLALIPEERKEIVYDDFKAVEISLENGFGKRKSNKCKVRLLR